jgi:hypothetical protein
MTVSPRAHNLLVLGAALFALYEILAVIVGSAMFARAPSQLGFAVTIDLTLTATLLVYWLGVRRGAVSPWFAVVTLSWGVAAARRWVPHAPIGALLAAGVALEIASVTWILIRIRRVVRATRAARDEGPIGSIEAGLIAARMPARLAALLATELAVAGLALTGWWRRPVAHSFAMRSTGWLLYAGVFGFLLVVESAAFHVAIAHVSPIAAWIATASSLYALLWIIGDAHAIRLYPVAITGDTLRIRLGIRWRASVRISDIVDVTPITAVPDGAANLTLIEPTVLVTLRAAIELRGLLGRRRTADRLALTLDDPNALIAALAAA